MVLRNGRLPTSAFAFAAFMCGSCARSASATTFASAMVTGLPTCAPAAAAISSVSARQSGVVKRVVRHLP
jgi:hypothetical protein